MFGLLLQDRMGQVVQSVIEFGDLFLNGRDPLLDQAGELQLRRFRGRVCSHLEKVGCNVDLGEGICEPLQDGFDVLHLVEAFPCSDVAPTRFSNRTCAHDGPRPPELNCAGWRMMSVPILHHGARDVPRRGGKGTAQAENHKLLFFNRKIKKITSGA